MYILYVCTNVRCVNPFQNIFLFRPLHFDTIYFYRTMYKHTKRMLPAMCTFVYAMALVLLHTTTKQITKAHQTIRWWYLYDDDDYCKMVKDDFIPNGISTWMCLCVIRWLNKKNEKPEAHQQQQQHRNIFSHSLIQITKTYISQHTNESNNFRKCLWFILQLFVGLLLWASDRAGARALT